MKFKLSLIALLTTSVYASNNYNATVISDNNNSNANYYHVNGKMRDWQPVYNLNAIGENNFIGGDYKKSKKGADKNLTNVYGFNNVTNADNLIGSNNVVMSFDGISDDISQFDNDKFDKNVNELKDIRDNYLKNKETLDNAKNELDQANDEYNNFKANYDNLSADEQKAKEAELQEKITLRDQKQENYAKLNKKFEEDRVKVVAGNANANTNVVGNENVVHMAYNTVFGDNNTIAGSYSVAIGGANKIVGLTNVAVGNGNQITGLYNNVMASGASEIKGDFNTVFGESAVKGNRNFVAGPLNEVTGDRIIVIGGADVKQEGKEANIINANDTTVIGYNNKVVEGATGNYLFTNNIDITNAELKDNVVLGNNSTLEAANPTAKATFKGKEYEFAGKAPTSVVSVGAIGKERQITHVAAGRISADSTDAVNGSQLNAIKESVDNLVLTGNNINPAEVEKIIDGKIAKEIQVEGGKNITVKRDGNRFTISADVTADIPEDLTVNSVTAKTITSDKVTTKQIETQTVQAKTITADEATIGGVTINQGMISNVQEGVNETDVVNVRQLQKQADSFNQRFDNLNDRVEKNRKRADAGTASVAAIAGIPQVMERGRSAVGVGVGSRGSQTAIAVGYSQASDNGHHIIKLSAGADTQRKTTLSAGYSYQW